MYENLWLLNNFLYKAEPIALHYHLLMKIDISINA